MSRVKRVKFSDPEADTDHVSNSRQDASFMGYETTRAPRCDAPKTSEYAFFRRLRKEVDSSHTLPLSRDHNQLKNAEPSDCNRLKDNAAVSNRFKPSLKDRRSSFLAEKARPGYRYSSFHTSDSVESKKSDVSGKVHHICKDFTSPLNTEKGTPVNHNVFPSPFGGASKNTVDPYAEKGVFFAKRQKLCQWIADTYVPEVEELCSKGVDLVPVLLSRLLPVRNEDKYCWDLKSKKGNADTTDQLPSFNVLGSQLRGLDWTCARKYNEHGLGSWLEDASSKYFSDRPTGRNLLAFDTVGSDSLTSSDTVQHNNRNYCFDLDGRGGSDFCKDSNSSFCLSWGRYGSDSSNHLQEDEFHISKESTLGREPCNLLLDWDFKKENDERELSLAYPNKVMNLYCTLRTSWDNDHQWSLCSGFDASDLISSSLFSSSPNFTPHLYSASFPSLEFQRQDEAQRHEVVELDHFPFTFSCTPKYLKLVKDSNADNSFEGKSMILSPQDTFTRIFNKKYQPSPEAFLPPFGSEFDLRLRCLSAYSSSQQHRSSPHRPFHFPLEEGMSLNLLSSDDSVCVRSSEQPEPTSHFMDGTLDSRDWSSIRFQISLDKDIGHPLLLDSSSWDRAEIP